MKTTDEAARLLGISKRRVQQLVQRGQLKATKWCRDWLIEEAELKRYRPRPVGRPKRPVAAGRSRGQ